jgi:hypothetical protein
MNIFNSIEDEILYYLNYALQIKNGIVTENEDSEKYYKKINALKYRQAFGTAIVENTIKDYLTKQNCSIDLVDSVIAVIRKA